MLLPSGGPCPGCRSSGVRGLGQPKSHWSETALVKEGSWRDDLMEVGGMRERGELWREGQETCPHPTIRYVCWSRGRMRCRTEVEAEDEVLCLRNRSDRGLFQSNRGALQKLSE